MAYLIMTDQTGGPIEVPDRNDPWNACEWDTAAACLVQSKASNADQ